MLDITEEKLDQIKLHGYRPVVVGCFINKQKILMVYKSEHKLWQLPQGGIESDENLSQALRREMKEELGLRLSEKQFSYLGQDAVNFPRQKRTSRELKTQSGQVIKMRGKRYFFLAIRSDLVKLNLKNTEFDDYRWLTYNEAKALTSRIYQAGKKRITLMALKLLHQNKLIA